MHLVITATLKGDIVKRVETAVARGLNEGGDLVRTQVRRALKEQTGVKAYRSITSRTEQAGKGTNRAAPGRLTYAIYASRKPIPLGEFPVKVTVGPGGGVDGKTWGVDHLFKRSFVLHGKFKARLGSARMPIRTLLGPNLAKELTKDRSAAAFWSTTAEAVPPAVLKQLAKALS